MNNKLTRGRGKKVLFTAVPADGHFNPLIRLARHLQELGYDVRWYAAGKYEKKLKQLQIPLFRFRKSIDITISDAELEFPERKKIKGALNKLKFDLKEFFIKRGPFTMKISGKFTKHFRLICSLPISHSPEAFL